VSRPLQGAAELVAATSQGLQQASGVSEHMPHTQRYQRRGVGPGEVLQQTQAHAYHRYSLLKLQQMAAQLGESYVAHAVVVFAPLPTAATSRSASSTTAATPASAPPSAYGERDAVSSTRAAQFALLLATNRGVRLTREDIVTHSFAWNELQLDSTRSQETPRLTPSSSTSASSPTTEEVRQLAAAFLDQRAMQDWLVPMAEAGDAEAFSPFAQLKLPFDILLLRPTHSHTLPIALWIPRFQRAVFLAQLLQAQKQAAVADANAQRT
jgi:hypothetical protein